MYTTDELFAMDGGARLHDVCVELDGKERSEKELRYIFENLPVNIKNIAHGWTIGDTVFGDEAYVWLKKNGIPAIPNQ
jgi:myo-inositol catabolism protein IolC